MIHPDTELRFKNSTVGYGVFATRPIPRGTIVWTLCALDHRISPTQHATFANPYLEIIDRYAYIDAVGDFILCWDHGRYINHSCAPSMLCVGEELEIAVRDLSPGDELTCEYGTLNLLEPMGCNCGEPNCRGTISTANMLDIADQQDQQAAEAVREFRKVPQPLLPFVRDTQTLFEWADGARAFPLQSSYYGTENHLAGILPPR